MVSPQIINSKERKVIGINMTMSMANNHTSTLWRTFMPRRMEVQGVSDNLISMQIYPEGYFQNFNPTIEFTKWACKEVNYLDTIPEGMESITIPEGDYAIFHYKGMPGDPSIFKYIFSEWLPKSNYQLDNRPHFEVLGSKYKQGSPNSEEEIWIPVRKTYL